MTPGSDPQSSFLSLHLQFGQHRVLFGPALLSVAGPVLKALTQAIVPVRKVLLTPVDVALIVAAFFVIVVGSSRFSILSALAIHCVMTFFLHRYRLPSKF